MKKLITILFILTSAFVMKAQFFCDASFTYQNDPITGITTLIGSSAANDSLAYPINYTWSFGDGTSATGQYVTHSFSPSGSYTVCLTIQTANGCTSTFCDSITGGNNTSNTCTANFYYLLDSVNTSSSTYSFIDYSSPDSASVIASYSWSFGDGSSSTLQNPVHTFTSPGTYYVCLNITTSSGCFSSNCQYIYVNSSQNTTCQAGFYSYIDSITVPPMTPVNFVDQSVPDSTSTIVSWLWDLGNGTTSNLQNPSASYQGPGTYTVCLTITTSSGCSNNYCETITINNTGCQLYANLTTQSPTTIGGNDGFIESAVFGGTAPYTYTWNNGANTANIYNLTSGVYTLYVTDANGCANSFTAMLYEPYDTTGGPIVDTLITNVLDTCLNFIPDSFYIASVTTNPSTGTVTVEWVFTGSGMTGSFTVEYSYVLNGNTAIILTINCGTKALASYLSFIHIYGATGILPVFGNDNDLVVYPVPFMDKLNIAFSGSGKVNVTIYDATGRKALTIPSFVATGAFNKEINTSNLPAGIYILNVENNGTVIHKQVIK